MAKLRKFAAYRAIKRPYTRKSKYKKKSYVRASPNLKIVRFDMGNTQKEFAVRVSLISNMPRNIRHEALEAARQASNRILEKGLGKLNYHLKIKSYPHHVLREHAMATGAGADRMSSGMAHGFGKAIGIAARIKEGQEIIYAEVGKANIKTARTAMKRANSKLPISGIIQIKNL